MRQTLSEYDDRDDGLHLVGEDRADEFSRSDHGLGRRLPTMLLTVFAMALFAGGLWFAYVQGTRHPVVAAGVQGSAPGDAVPLIRADERPTKVKPDQPGGMAIPDQNVSLYNEKPGGEPVEKLLPAAEQPMPRPAPAAKEAAIPPPPIPPAPQAATVASPLTSSAAPVANSPAKPAAKVAPPPAAKALPRPRRAAAVPAPASPAGKAGPVQLRLGSLRSPEAAREEWARLKRENSDLLGNLTAVAVRTDLGSQGIYYRIQAGSFGDAAAAEKLCGELKRRKLGCILAR
jgi:hypothetical protein